MSGQNVRIRGLRAVVTGVTPSSVDPECAQVNLRVIAGERQGDTFAVFVPIDHVEAEAVPPLQIERLASFPLWCRYHDAYRLELAPPPNALAANPQAQIDVDEYQMVPAKRLLELPRPRLLIADDVGLGKTVEAGLAYLELSQRRLAKRVLIVTPASLRKQWRDELYDKFGIEFDIFDREAVDVYRKQAEIGANPWLLRPRIIVSIDSAKMDSTFAELRRTSWDLAIIDEAHHVVERTGDSPTQNRRFAQWLAQNTRGLLLLSATPHDGDDESFASLLRLLEPRIAIEGALEQSVRSVGRDYVIRRLKRDVAKADGTPRFVPRAPVQAIPVTLTRAERQLHDEVLKAVETVKERAKRASGDVRSRSEFLTTILRKRLASSRAALGRTLANRRETLSEDLESLQSRRDLLRRARASEPLTDVEQAQLERELHAASLESTRRSLTRATRMAAAEGEEFARLQELCDAMSGEPESKVEALIDHLRRLWGENPEENVIVFTEYRDTAESLGGEDGQAPLRRNFGDRVILLHGEIDGREERLQRFCQGDGKVLVTTDVASEGLNLQERCRTVIHYDLPWNPNRLEQRNGRVDRYKQMREPHIGFLYAAETYDGELLRLLAEKIERQIQALGSVGDVLGSLQNHTIESLFDDPATTITPEVRRSLEMRVRQAVEDAAAPRIMQELQGPSEGVIRREQPELGAFVAAAVTLCGGHAREDGASLELDRLPAGWDADVVRRYALPGGPPDLRLLTLQTPLARAAVSAIRELRYDTRSDPRAAARAHAAVKEPTLVATFLISVRSKDGFTEERLDVVGMTEAGSFVDDAECLLSSDRFPEPPDLQSVARQAFLAWWERAYDALRERAESRAQSWSNEIATERQRMLARHRAALNEWYAAERSAFSRGRESGSLMLFADSSSAAGQRELAKIDRERERQRDELDARATVEPALCQPVGLLLVMPVPR